jgi:hypothetical protein
MPKQVKSQRHILNKNIHNKKCKCRRGIKKVKEVNVVCDCP